MPSDFTVVVNGINKCYRVFQRPQDRIKQLLVGKRKKYFKEFWALRDVSFSIKKGEAVGIIGRNGSGKSTVLQIISKTLQQSSGEIRVNGRVAALLELGSGFNPEFTGRENIKLNGAIMGLSLKEIENRIPSIAEFADIGDFLDQPVKTYSSGMFVRLAFSCAVNVDPDILIVDEALAVGDMQFQLKCLDKMKEFKRSGKTILFVSHDSNVVRNFCDRAIWMREGQVYLEGDVNMVTELYQDYIKRSHELGVDITKQQPELRNDIVTINRVRCVDVNGQEKQVFGFGESLMVEVDYILNKPMSGVVGGVAIYDAKGAYICGLNTKLDGESLPEVSGTYRMCLKYEKPILLPGTFFIDVGFFESSAIVHLDYRSRACWFRVESGEYFAEGLSFLEHKWECGVL